MSNGAPPAQVLGIPLDTNHVMVALGGAAAAIALGPAILALPVVGAAASAMGITIGETGLGAIGGYLAAKHIASQQS